MRARAHKLFDCETIDRRCPGCGIAIVFGCVHDAFCFDCKPELLHAVDAARGACERTNDESAE